MSEKSSTKKNQTKNVQANTIEKMFDKKSFDKISTNTLSFSDNPDPDLITIWKDIFMSIKRVNPDVRSYSASIMLLFSSIGEIFYLHKDRETRQRQKQEMYEEWIDYKNYLISEKLEFIALAENNISSIKTEALEKKKEHNADVKNKDNKITGNNLRHAQRRKINDYLMLIKEHEMAIGQLKMEIKGHQRSKELRMFEVSKNEKLTFDMTAQIANKNEKIIILMKEFGINPRLADVTQFKSNNSVFGALEGIDD